MESESGQGLTLIALREIVRGRSGKGMVLTLRPDIVAFIADLILDIVIVRAYHDDLWNLSRQTKVGACRQ